ncbi:helix-turn-helix domain-containing protein [Catalinimonas sp. 4WD22]|uniref:helix-turn-helix domain-containing protein n=1 Tax=Catalinimonas locisalis TaxID=3133978 RepID=UPI003101B2E8
MTDVVLLSMPVDEFRVLISETVKEELAQLRPAPANEKKYRTRKETADLLHISLPTLNERTKKGEIEGSRIGGRLLYSEEAIERALTSTNLKKRGGRS